MLSGTLDLWQIMSCPVVICIVNGVTLPWKNLFVLSLNTKSVNGCCIISYMYALAKSLILYLLAVDMEDTFVHILLMMYLWAMLGHLSIIHVKRIR